MTLKQKHRKWTVEEFLAWHELQDERYELVSGFPVLKRPPVPIFPDGQSVAMMMTGASPQNNQVNCNLFRRVADQLGDSDFHAFASDAAVRTGENAIRYPDLVVDRGTTLDDGYVFNHPCLVAEVVSPSTSSFDFASKVTEYWRIETLCYVLIVDPEQGRAQLHTGKPGDAPTLQLFKDSDDIIALPAIGVTLRLGDMFEGLPSVAPAQN